MRAGGDKTFLLVYASIENQYVAIAMLRIYVAKPRGEGGREHFPLVAAKTHRRDRGPGWWGGEECC